jgi:hypothetical protein
MIVIYYKVWAMVHVLLAAYQTTLYIMTATYHTMTTVKLLVVLLVERRQYMTVAIIQELLVVVQVAAFLAT